LDTDLNVFARRVKRAPWLYLRSKMFSRVQT
jgi:hypothetical protein